LAHSVHRIDPDSRRGPLPSTAITKKGVGIAAHAFFLFRLEEWN